MTFGTYVVASKRHGTVGIDDERRANHAYVYLAVELLFAICAVQLVHGQVGIRQQRECEMIALCKLAQLVKRVLGDAKHRNVFDANRARLSRKSQASVVQPGVIAAG